MPRKRKFEYRHQLAVYGDMGHLGQTAASCTRANPDYDMNETAVTLYRPDAEGRSAGFNKGGQAL